MKKFNFKKHLLVLTGTFALATGSFAFSSVISSANTTSTNISLTNQTTNASTKANARAANVLPAGINADGSFNIQTQYPQYKVYDDNNSAFAIMTADNSITPTNSYSFTQVSKYYTTSTTDDQGNITHAAGSLAWTIDQTKFKNTFDSATDSNKPTDNFTGFSINAILYSSGGYTIAKSLFVLCYTNTGSYVFQVEWETNATLGTNEGTVKLVQVLSKNTDAEGLVKYNALVLESPATHTMQALYINNNITSNNTDINIKYANISNGTFNNKVTAKTFKMLVTLNQNYFAPNTTYSVAFVRKSNSSIFIVFSANQYTDANKDKALVLVNATITKDSNDNLESTAANYKSISLADSGFSANQTFKTNVLADSESVTNTRFTLIISNSTDQTSGNLVLTSINTNQFSTTPTLKTIQNVVVNSDATGSLTKSFVSQISPVYTTNTATISYYVGLTSDNLAIKLDTNFNYVSTLYDFNKSSISSMGKIWNIYTKSGDSNWYAQMTDGTFAQFTESTFIGQWDQLLLSSSTELPVNITVKEESEIDSTILYQKVANDTDTDYNPEFTAYLATTGVYENFLSVNFQDPRLNGQLPEISITASTFTKPTSGKNYSVTLTFKQTLRQIDSAGNITAGTTSEIDLGSKTYTFINEDGVLEPANGAIDGTTTVTNNIEMPSYVRSMLPSQVASLINADTNNGLLGEKNYAVVNNIVKLANADNATFYASGNDTTGVLTLNVSVPAFWTTANGNGLRSLNAPYPKTFTFGTSTEPYFDYNPFGNESATSVTPKDDTYFANTTNSTDVASLKSKYGSISPSSVSAMDLFNDFFVLGSAFLNEANITAGTIQMPTTDDIQVIPFDADGYAYISVNFPKVGNKLNVRYTLQTPKIFKANGFVNSTNYFVWKSSDISNLTLNGAALNTKTATEIANMISNSSSEDTEYLLSTYFASYSNDFLRLFESIEATADDAYGTLTIKGILTEEAKKAGYNQDNYISTFSGFAKSGNMGTGSTFSFGDKGLLTNLMTYSPSEITADQLVQAGFITLPSEYQSGTNYTITLTPSNVTGSLGVSITFNDWKDGTTSVPKKTFSTVISGFTVTGTENSMIVWRTASGTNPISQSIASLTPSKVAETKANQDPLTLLEDFALVSDSLKAKLTNDNVKVYFVPDDTIGSLKVTANIELNGVVQSFSSTISGFKAANTNPTVTIVADNLANSSLLAALKSKKPSDVTVEDLATLYTPQQYNTDVWQLEVQLQPDDAKGTLTVSYSFSAKDGSYTTDAQTVTYSGLQVYIPMDKGTDWLVVGLSAAIPLVVLSAAIFTVGYVQTRKDMKKIARRLDKRLEEERKKQIRRKYLLNM